MRSISHVLISTVLAVVAFAPAPAFADGGVTIQGEADFLARYGQFVLEVVPHVYVFERGGETIRVAFGSEGWRHERPRVEQQLREAQQALMKAKPSERAMLEEAVSSLSAMLEEPAAGNDQPISQTSETKTGSYCGASYTLNLAPDHFWNGNSYYPNPQISLYWVEFGPPSPWNKDVVLNTGIKVDGAYVDFDSVHHLFGGTDVGTNLSVQSLGGPMFCWQAFTQVRFSAYPGSPACPDGTFYIYRQYNPCG